MSLAHLITPTFQSITPNGLPNVSGWVEVYVAGSTEKAQTWASEDVENPWPTPLDSNGAGVFLAESSGVYDISVYDSQGVLLYSRTSISPGISWSTSEDSITSAVSVLSAELEDLYQQKFEVSGNLEWADDDLLLSKLYEGDDYISVSESSESSKLQISVANPKVLYVDDPLTGWVGESSVHIGLSGDWAETSWVSSTFAYASALEELGTSINSAVSDIQSWSASYVGNESGSWVGTLDIDDKTWNLWSQAQTSWESEYSGQRLGTLGVDLSSAEIWLPEMTWESSASGDLLGTLTFGEDSISIYGPEVSEEAGWSQETSGSVLLGTLGDSGVYIPQTELLVTNGDTGDSNTLYIGSGALSDGSTVYHTIPVNFNAASGWFTTVYDDVEAHDWLEQGWSPLWFDSAGIHLSASHVLHDDDYLQQSEDSGTISTEPRCSRYIPTPGSTIQLEEMDRLRALTISLQMSQGGSVYLNPPSSWSYPVFEGYLPDGSQFHIPSATLGITDLYSDYRGDWDVNLSESGQGILLFPSWCVKGTSSSPWEDTLTAYKSTYWG